jgi:hypothetical protein
MPFYLGFILAIFVAAMILHLWKTAVFLAAM